MRCDAAYSLPTAFHDPDQLIGIFDDMIQPHETLLQPVLLLCLELFELSVVFTVQTEHVLALVPHHHLLREEGLGGLGTRFDEGLEIRMEFSCCHEVYRMVLIFYLLSSIIKTIFS